jgi:site-specific DNA recombinase
MKNNMGDITQERGLRCAIYGRFSSSMQRPASLEDQERNCREAVAAKGMVVEEQFVRNDHAISGKSMLNRDGINALVAAAKQRPRPFEYIVMDDTSRLGRNLGDVLKIHQTLKHHGVDLYFVSQRLDSRDGNFHTMLTFLGMQDEQHLERLGKAVHRGQRGRVLQGFHTGVAPFGYKNVRLFNAVNPEDYSRANQLGSDLEIIESEAETIRRIYDMFAGGLSIHRIETILNEENVPAARRPRIGDLPSAWNSNLINRILRNEKYIGINTWNKTKQYTDPDTGKIDIRKKPESALVRIECPKWRIVSDELWNSVQQRLGVVNEKMTARRVAGTNRGKNKDYLFSGLLWCGVCGGPIVITGGKGSEASYGCRLARYKRGCSNKLRIRADRFAALMVDAMQKQVLSDDFLDYFVESVYREVMEKLEHSRREAAKVDRSDLIDAKKKNDHYIAKLVGLISQLNEQDTSALVGPLSTAQAEERRLKKLLEVRSESDVRQPTLDELRLEIVTRASNLKEILFSDFASARAVLQQYIGKLTLIPTESPTGPIYEVLGDLDLFAPNSSLESPVMLGGESTANFQHYTDTRFGFAGIQIDPRIEGDDEEGPVRARTLCNILADLLSNQPDLQGKMLSAREWELQFLAATGKHDSEEKKLFAPKYMSWILTTYDEMFRRSLGMNINRDSHTGTKKYSFCLYKPEQQQPAYIRPTTITGYDANAVQAA